MDVIQPKDSCNTSPVRMLWKDSTAMDIARYRDCVEKELSYIYIPVEAAVCNDPDNCEHKSELQSFYDALVRVMVKTGKRCIPRGKGKFVGWNTDLKDLKCNTIYA